MINFTYKNNQLLIFTILIVLSLPISANSVHDINLMTHKKLAKQLHIDNYPLYAHNKFQSINHNNAIFINLSNTYHQAPPINVDERNHLASQINLEFQRLIPLIRSNQTFYDRHLAQCHHQFNQHNISINDEYMHELGLLCTKYNDNSSLVVKFMQFKNLNSNRHLKLAHKLHSNLHNKDHDKSHIFLKTKALLTNNNQYVRAKNLKDKLN